MTYKVRLKAKAEKNFAKFPKNIQERILAALDDIETFPEDTARSYRLKKPLTGYKRRVGKYRILFDIENNEIVVRNINKRDTVYKR